MSYRGYKGIRDPANGCSAFVSIVMSLTLGPLFLGGLGLAIGSAAGSTSGGAVGAFLGAAVGLIAGIWNTVTMPERVRKARRMRGIYNDLYRRL